MKTLRLSPPALVALRALCVFAVTCLLTACLGPDYHAIANRLRETNLKQEREISGLKEQLASRDATLQSLRANAPTIPTLPPERLAELFTPASIELRNTSDSWDAGDGKGISGFRVFVRMFSQDGQVIPASGKMTIEAFELPAPPAPPRRIGVWTFQPSDMKKVWYSGWGQDQFAFNCPWDALPTLPDITLKVRFEDALTGNVFAATLNKKIALPPSSPPPTTAASAPSR